MKKIKFEIENLEGIHIGTALNPYEKGAVDSYTIKDSEGYPYIPATSIKGKVRFFLDNLSAFDVEPEFIDRLNEKLLPEGKNLDSNDKSSFKQLSKVLFGSYEKGENNFEFNQMKKVLFKDAKLTSKPEKAEQCYEIKAENSIEINGTEVEANPRIIERTVPNLKYQFEIIIVGFEQEELIGELLEIVFELITEYGYIGGNGSRGYGQVTITKK